MKNILIIGATSAIAAATARLFARRGDRLFLAARDTARLATLAADLKVRGAAAVECHPFEAARFDEHKPLIDAAFKALKKPDIVLLAHGTLPEQKVCEADFDAALRELNANAVGSLSLLTQIANRLEQQRGGCLAVITSVAGERGRQSNYLYGAAKAMVSVFLQGLRNRLHQSGVQVLDIRPGFVDTPMTAAFQKGPLWAKPRQIAAGIVRAIEKKKTIVYLPWFWRYVMLLIRLIPEPIFKRLTL